MTAYKHQSILVQFSLKVHFEAGKSSDMIYLGLIVLTSQKPAMLTGVCRLFIAIVNTVRCFGLFYFCHLESILQKLV